MSNGEISGSSAEPRRFWEEPRRFGKGAGRPALIPEASPSDAHVQAALFQHRLALTIRLVLVEAGQSLKEYVNDPKTRSEELTYDRAVRLLRGESIMQFSDLFFWAQRSATVRRDLATYQFGWTDPAKR